MFLNSYFREVICLVFKPVCSKERFLGGTVSSWIIVEIFLDVLACC